jgi:hypothetical protein
LRAHSIAQHAHLGAGEQRDLIQLALGVDLLHRADQGIHHPLTDAGERIVVLAQRNQRDADCEQNVVEEVEQVGANDVPVRSAGAKAGGVGFAALLARADFLLRQALNHLHCASHDLCSRQTHEHSEFCIVADAGRPRKPAGRYIISAGVIQR